MTSQQGDDMNNQSVISRSDRTLVYRPSGPLDITRAEAFRDVLSSDAEPGTEVVLDLSAVTRVDASGLGVLVRAVRRVWRSGRSVRVIDPCPHVARLLSLTGIDRVVPVEVAGAAPGDRAA
jgi:anti-anti-sigma factor